jgi:hypothetical protein
MPTKAKSPAGSKTSRKRSPARNSVAAAGTARKKSIGGAAAKSSSEVVAEQMPGWKLAPTMRLRSPSYMTEGDMKIETGPSIAQLRRKFLSDGASDGALTADDSSILANVNRRVKTVQVEPKSGGPAKTADIRGGKITIVQG